MERMKELTVAIQDEYEGKVIYRTKLYTEEEYKKLEEENKKLRELKCVPSNLKTVIRIDKENEWLEEENRKLNEWKENLIRADKKKSDHIDNLEEENRKLKEEKEKSDSFINKKIIDLHNQVVELLEENKKLKECNSNLMKEVKLCYKELEK